jgi:hypothetical protein
MWRSLLPTGLPGCSYSFFWESFAAVFGWKTALLYAENRLAIARQSVFAFAAMSFPAVTQRAFALVLKANQRGGLA